jgi:broad specificity phosphatase PhoE
MLILVRHGESTSNAAGLLAGRSDAPLTDAGRLQARAIAGALGPVDDVISSPLQRALATAAEVCPGQPVTIDPRWVEVDYGELEELPLGAVPDDVWNRWRTDAQYRPPGGECLTEVTSRVSEACEELFLNKGSGGLAEAGNVVVVSHVSPIKAAVAWALRVDPTVASRMHLATASVTRIGWSGRGPILHTFNEVLAPR